jgi:hypothetical protein
MIHGVELPDFLQKKLTLRARLPLCRQSHLFGNRLANEKKRLEAVWADVVSWRFLLPCKIGAGAQLTFSSPCM